MDNKKAKQQIDIIKSSAYQNLKLLADLVRELLIVPACKMHGLSFVNDRGWRFEMVNVTDEQKNNSRYHNQWTGVISDKEDCRIYGFDLYEIIDTLSLETFNGEDLGDLITTYINDGYCV